ncbi:MAG: DUF6101 family protein [Xanthobacteraceae bacterium]
MRRQATSSRLTPGGSSRRLDPFALPLAFAVTDHTADERVRFVELHRERVVMRRALRGIKMALNFPIAAFVGVAIRIEPPTAEHTGAVTIVLEHRDCALSVPLCRSADGEDIVAEWQAWGRVLRLPLLVADAQGNLRQPFDHMGGVRTAPPVARRRQRSMLKARRPSLPLRRPAGSAAETPVVYDEDREIIARD